MTDLVVMQNNRALTTSVQIAEVFGKRHDHVLRDIEFYSKDVPNFGEMFQPDDNSLDTYGRKRKAYLMNRDGFSLMAMSFTGKEALSFKLDFINAFNQMEESIKHQVQIPSNPMEALELMFTAIKDSSKEVKAIDSRVIELEENVLLSAADYGTITKNVSQRVNQVIRERKMALNNKQRAELFKDINGSIKKITGTRNRSNLRTKHYDVVYQFIMDWQPSTATMTIIRSLGDEE